MGMWICGKFPLANIPSVRETNENFKNNYLIFLKIQFFSKNCFQFFKHFILKRWEPFLSKFPFFHVFQIVAATPLVHNLILSDDKKSILASRFFLQVSNTFISLTKLIYILNRILN